MKTKLLEDIQNKTSRESKDMTDYYIKMCKWCSSKFSFLGGGEINTSKEFVNSIKFLKWDINSRDVITFSRFAIIAGLLFFGIFNALFFLFVQQSFLIMLISFIIPFLIAHMITDFPKTEANLERIDALGEAPTILTHLVIYLKQNPNLERALEFVSKHSKGRISKDIKKILWNCLVGKKTNIKRELRKIGERWEEYSSELKRSIYLVISSVSEKNEIKRNQTLDKAINISLEGIVNKTKEYTNQLHLPTLFLFSFGTILPLVIISLLPIFSFIGKEFSSPLQMFLLLIISLIAIYFYSNSILVKRPPTFSSVKLPKNLKIYPKQGNLKLKFGKKIFEANAMIYCTLVFLIISFPGILYLISEIPGVTFVPSIFSNMLQGFNTLTIIWGFGASIVLYSYGTSWYKKNVRDEIKKLEEETIDGTYQLASRIDEGRSPEETIKHIGKTMDTTIFGKIMKKTYMTLRSRHTTLENAFFNREHGSLKKVYSNQFKLIVGIFLNSLKRGIKNSAQTLFTISNHYDMLDKTEKKLKTTLKNALSMMKTTACIFAPMITGLIITLQQIIQDGLAETQQSMAGLGFEYMTLPMLQDPSISVEMLQLVAGVYMILLAYLLIRYVSLLQHGKDEVILKQEIYKNIPIALFIFTFTLIISRLLLG